MKRLYIVMILVFQIHFMSAQILKSVKRDSVYYDMKEVLDFENISFAEKDTVYFPIIPYRDAYDAAITYRNNKEFKKSNELFLKLSQVNDTLKHFFEKYGTSFDSDKLIILGFKGLAENYYILKQYDKARELYEKTVELEMKHNSKEFVFFYCYAKRKQRRKQRKKRRRKLTKLEKGSLRNGYFFDFEEREIQERIEQIKNGIVKDKR